MAQIIKRGNTYTIRVSAGFDSKGKRINLIKYFLENLLVS